MALNDVVYNKTVDVAQSMPVPVVFAKQNENGKRKVIVTLLKNGQPFLVGTDISGYIQGATAPNPATKQPVRFKRDLTLIDAEGNASTATFAIAESMTAEIGITQCEIALYDSTKPNEILCTANINIEVQGTGMSPQDEMASDDYQAIVSIKAEVTAMRDEVRTKTAEAIAAQGAAETAAQNAYNSALGVQKIVAGNEAYTKQEADLKYSVAPRKAQTNTTGELKLTDADYGLSYIELQGNSEQYTNTANKNLIDLNFATDGYSISSTGTLDKNEQYFATGYIVVEPGEQYTFTRAVSIANRQGCFYDEDKVFLQPWTGDAGLSKNTVTVPENAKYLRLFDYISHKQESQLEKGNVATDYVIGAVDTPTPEYPSEVKSVGDIPKDVNGVEIRNLLDEDYLKNPDHWSVQGESLYYVKLSPSVAKLFGAAYKISHPSFAWRSILYLSETLTAGVNMRITLVNNAGGTQSGSYTFPSADPIYLIAYNRNADEITKAQFIDELFKCYKLMITEAAEVDEYRPYIGENNGLVKIESKGKNLFPGKGVVIGCIGAGGVPSNNTRVLRTDFIKVDKNKQYVFNPGTLYSGYVYLYDGNKKYIDGLGNTAIFNSGNAEYVILQFNSSPSVEQTQVNVDVMNKTLQLEEGTQTTKYQPYYNQITWIPLREPLRSISVSGGYTDKVDKDGNVTIKVTERHYKDLHIAGLRPSYGYNDNIYFTAIYSSPANTYDESTGLGGYPSKDFTISTAMSQLFKVAKIYSTYEAVLIPGLDSNPHYISMILKYDRLGLTSSATDGELKTKLTEWLVANDPIVYLGIFEGSQFLDIYKYQIPVVYVETYEQETNVRCLNKVKPSSMGLDYKIAISSLIKRLEALESAAVNNGGK